MKNLLLTVTSIATLTLSSSINCSLLTNKKTNNSNNITNNSNINNGSTSKFNNIFNALGDDDWHAKDKDGKIISNFFITNQSTTDYKYYTYDLHHANYQLPDSQKYAYIFFIVDSTGLLQYTVDYQNLSSKDQNSLFNSKTEMEKDKKVITNNNTYNPYSCSLYNKSFNNVTDWQYLQFGGAQKTIDISSQKNANKIDNYQNLSETLGLYYIATAVKQQKIDEALGDNLANYFINNSSFKGKITKSLTKKIISLISCNKEIYDLISNMPFTNSDKNYSLNLIFDNDNNLVAIYYHNWLKTQIINSIEYTYSNDYGVFGQKSDSSGQIILISNWNHYAHSWDEFTQFYPKFFPWRGDTFMILATSDKQTSGDLGFSSTASITSSKVPFLNLSLYVPDYSPPPIPTNVNFDLDIWHDDTNIYFQWFLNISGPSSITIKINFGTISFSN